MSVIARGRLAGNTTVEQLPYASWAFTNGWVPNAAPAVAEPGGVVNANLVAVVALTVIMPCVPVMVPVTVSVAVIDRVPEVFNVALKVWTPLSALTNV